LNAALWVPWFFLPTSTSLPRIVDLGTFIGDLAIGKISLNFFMDKVIFSFAGVDQTQFLGEDGDSSLNSRRWGRCGLGLMPSPFVAVQTMAWLEETIKGEQSDPSNVFHWDGFRLDLPGSATYDPAKPWVFKFRSRDGRIAADYILYIDDSRPTCPTLDECRKSQKNKCDRGFLIYVAQTYPALVPYLKGISLTLDGWRV
jgi:hypothetical protein